MCDQVSRDYKKYPHSEARESLQPANLVGRRHHPRAKGRMCQNNKTDGQSTQAIERWYADRVPIHDLLRLHGRGDCMLQAQAVQTLFVRITGYVCSWNRGL